MTRKKFNDRERVKLKRKVKKIIIRVKSSTVSPDHAPLEMTTTTVAPSTEPPKEPKVVMKEKESKEEEPKPEHEEKLDTRLMSDSI